MALTWTKRIAGSVMALVALAVCAVLVTQRLSDGPIEFLQGGPFSSGELVEDPVTDWSFGIGKRTEFELVGYGTSRTAGYIIHDGVAYMTCDLGFIWRRLAGAPRYLLHLIYLFKDWHEDALTDGRALIRIDGRIYKTRFVKVDDPDLEQELRSQVESLAREFFASDLGPPRVEPPNDIWFFRMTSGW